jgi:hypothetical protein
VEGLTWQAARQEPTSSRVKTMVLKLTFPEPASPALDRSPPQALTKSARLDLTAGLEVTTKVAKCAKMRRGKNNLEPPKECGPPQDPICAELSPSPPVLLLQ